MAFIICLLTILSPLLSETTQDIEKSFLQNNPKMLYKLFSSKSFINISLPEPISFSDQLSNQQTYFLFRKIFFSYLTFEFYSESEPPLLPEKNHFIFKARWSFKNKKNNNQYVYHIFFFLTNEKNQKSEASFQSFSKKNNNLRNDWKIIEIKAEKI